MIRLVPGVTLEDVYAASDSMPTATLQSEPYASRLSASLALVDRAAAAIGRRGAVKVTSMMRSKERNDSLPNASHTSSHLTGWATDFQIPGENIEVVFQALRSLAPILKYDQLIVYDTHFHLSADPRARRMVIDKRSAQDAGRLADDLLRPGRSSLAAMFALALMGTVLLLWRSLRGS